MKEVTNERLDALDQRIRERIFAKLNINPQSDLPTAAMIQARVSLGWGTNLENACPYVRDCNNKTQIKCIKPVYRECPFYKTHLADDILAGNIELVEIEAR
jgi:hypothetical protein